MASIASVANGCAASGKDGLNITVVLDQPAAGTLVVNCSSTPGDLGPAMVATLDPGSDVSYTVRITSPSWDPSIIRGTAIPVWVTATDDSGPSGQAALFLKAGVDCSDGKEIAEHLRSILVANLPLINWRLAALSTLDGAVEIQTVTVGGNQQVPEGHPAIDIRMMTFPEGQWELPLTRLKEPQLSITVFAYHQNEMSWWDLIVEASCSIRDLLASVPYEQITLASGLELRLCLVGNQEYFEGRTAESLWATTAQLTWSCNYGLGYPGRLGD